MKLFIYVFAFFQFGAVLGQNTLEITYGKKLIVLPKYKNNVNYSKKIAAFKKGLKFVEYKLLIKENQSYFEYIEKLDTKKAKSFRNVLSGDMKKNFYTNTLTKKRQYITEIFNENYLVSQPYNYHEWKLNKDSKIILGFKTYKATTTVFIDDFRGKSSYPLEVWYAPELPSGFGPSSYSGLPGTVLEVLYDNKINIFAKKILETETEISLKKLKGQNVSEEELIKIFNDGMNRIKNGG